MEVIRVEEGINKEAPSSNNNNSNSRPRVHQADRRVLVIRLRVGMGRTGPKGTTKGEICRVLMVWIPLRFTARSGSR